MNNSEDKRKAIQADDIVTRLREVAVQEYKDGWAVFPVCDRAADEIERLRNLSKELLEALAEMADKKMLPTITVRLRDAAQALEQTVRSE